MSLRNSDEEKDVSVSVLRDRVLTHAVEVVKGLAGTDGDVLARGIEQAFVKIGARCRAAGMVPLSTSMFGAGCTDAGQGIISVVVMCNWMHKDDLEAMQRQQALQQALMGGQNGIR